MSQTPLARMIGYIGTKMETLELTRADIGDDKELVWRSDIAKAEHGILNEIVKTLSLVEAFEGDFKQILERKMPRRAVGKK